MEGQNGADHIPSSSETHWLYECDNSIRPSILEPFLRKVVREEIEEIFKQYFSPEILRLTKPSSLSHSAPQNPNLKLVFSKNLNLPIFTSNKILDIENNPLEISLVNANNSSTPISLHPSPKVELVVLDANFPPRDCESWTSHQFEENIIKARQHKPPLLIGELIVTLSGGSVQLGEISFSDNSSWIQNRKFRIGARIAPGTNLTDSRVLEAFTEGFVVREYRVGLIKKHHPPLLHDEVWRLVEIGKDGVFHKRLASESINTVQHFLNLADSDPKRLRTILGARMSQKKWDAVLKHAQTCVGNNVTNELGSYPWVHQGTVTESTSLNQGPLMDQNLGHQACVNFDSWENF